MSKTIRIQTEPGYIMHRKQYGENGCIVYIFTKNYGIVHAITRKIAKHKKALIQPFSACFVSWTQKQSIASLGPIEERKKPMIYNGRQLASAFYINEITVKALAQGDAIPALFNYYEHTLEAIYRKPDKLALSLRLYEKKLLEATGYAIPFLSHYDHEWYTFTMQDGFIPQKSQHPHAVHANTLSDFAVDSITTIDGYRQIKILMQQLLSTILVDKRIQSRMLLSG